MKFFSLVMIFHKNSIFKMHTLLGYLCGLNFNNKNNCTHFLPLNKQSASMYIPGCSLNITVSIIVWYQENSTKSRNRLNLVDHTIFITISFQSASIWINASFQHDYYLFGLYPSTHVCVVYSIWLPLSPWASLSFVC